MEDGAPYEQTNAHTFISWNDFCAERHTQPKAVKKAKWNLNDIDLFEINEAFAAQSIAVIRELNIDEHKVNVNGGAIALGHPIGCSESRILATLINVLKEKNAKTGIASLCIGGGMGIAIAIKLQ